MIFSKFGYILATLGILSLPIATITSHAQVAPAIDLNYLISDSELVDYDSMSQTEIKAFLTQRNSVLKNMFFDVGELHTVSATEIIYRAAHNHQINPKFLLTLIEKEQSLVSGQNPTQRAIDFATGYGCFTGQTCLDRWKGFPKQINSAAAQFRYYIENIDEYAYQPGVPKTICNDRDGRCEVITPINVSTAALYVYTPHVHGNELFRKIWVAFFSGESIYPDGSILQAEGEDGVWLIQNGKRRPFSSRASFVSRFSDTDIISVSQTDLDGYPEGSPIEFAAYTLVKDPTGTIYLLTADNKRPIESAEVFRVIGFNPEEVENVTAEQIADIPIGTMITVEDAHPVGALVQNNQSGGVYFVESGVKYPLWSREVMIANFPKLKIFAASPQELDSYDNGAPARFRDGLLVKAKDDPTVYVISNGTKIKIANEATFNKLGYKWTNIIETNAKMLTLHNDGGDLSI